MEEALCRCEAPLKFEPEATQTYGQGPAGALTICFEERISANRRGLLELAALHSSHYQLEDEPLAKKNWSGLPLSP